MYIFISYNLFVFEVFYIPSKQRSSYYTQYDCKFVKSSYVVVKIPGNCYVSYDIHQKKYFCYYSFYPCAIVDRFQTYFSLLALPGFNLYTISIVYSLIVGAEHAFLKKNRKLFSRLLARRSSGGRIWSGPLPLRVLTP